MLTVDQILYSANGTVVDALKVVEKNHLGLVFVINDNKLAGTLTDGDVRRYLIAGGDLSDDVTKAMNCNPIFVYEGVTPLQLQEKLSKGVTVIPILNQQNMVIDYATRARLHQIPLINTDLSGNELEYVSDCIESGWVSSQGAYVKKFEATFGEFVGNSNSLAVSNGTVALHLALAALGVGEGDEVIVPDLTFISPVNAVIYCGAHPVILDVDKDSYALDASLIEQNITEKTKAIILVHLYGKVGDITAIMSIAKKYGIFVIEDCAEALGSYYKGVHVGNFGDAATFSFFGNKTITTGEGGMVLFKNTDILEKARILRDHGMSPTKRYWHEYVGFNYRITNLQAALGVAQMERLPSILEKKRRMAIRYSEGLKILDDVFHVCDKADVSSHPWLYVIHLLNSAVRDELIAYMTRSGIEVRPVFYPVHLMPPYTGYANSLSNEKVSAFLSQSGLCLPSSANIQIDEIDYVIQSIKNFFRKDDK